MSSFGSSIIVPSVQELVKQEIAEIPDRYIRTSCSPDHDTNQSDSAANTIPVINIQSLLSGELTLADNELEKLHSACKDWGFFQAVDHGVSLTTIEKIKLEIHNLFELPIEEKKKFWQKPDDHEGFGQLFVVSDEQKLDWSDMFYISTLPSIMRKPHLFEEMPSALREAVEEYAVGLKKLTITILEQMAKALKMDLNEMRELFSDCYQSMRLNYYPPCPKADQVLGFSPHSDADALTIVLQLNETEGLQIRKDGNWVPVKPIHNAFVVNIGDIMEIVSNGVYRSIEHRAVVDSTKERLSVAAFHSTNLDAELGPVHSLISPPHKPALFRREAVETYFKNFFARKLDGKSYLDSMRIDDKQKDHSLIVPSVQELVKQEITEIPDRYIRTSCSPDHDTNPSDSAANTIPVINIQSLLSGDLTLADNELEKLHSACKEWGFFQAVDHGVSLSTIEKIKLEIHNLFELPLEEKEKLWQKPGDHEGFGQLFVVSDEQKLDWSDMFYISTLPTIMRKPHLEQEALEEYAVGLKKLTVTILEQMAKALKMDSNEMRELFSDCYQSMRLNYYPPCSKAEQVLGFSPHSDADALTIVLQLNETEGLQIRKDGNWVPVKPIHNALLSTLIVSNGVYRSIEHRAVVNSTNERLSIAAFHSTNLDAELGPAHSLINPPHKPALFRRAAVETYFKNFFARKLDGKSYLDSMRIDNEQKDQSS
ncbi:hypothetical protein MKW92_038076 [Papaver armeniacum]|nr:hypothetical protein MKW92_038076 [Papaver armeniacum]